MKKIICQTDEQIDEAKKELRFLQKVKHANIVSLLGSEIISSGKGSKQEIFFLMPLYSGNVQAIIDKGRGYPSCAFEGNMSGLMAILLDTCRGLEAIHRAGYRHGDLKPANILLNHEGRAVLTDFGSISPLVVEVSNRTMALKVQEEAAVYTTASYRSPELFDTPSSCIIDSKSDVWSFGCVMYSIAYSRSPFESEKEGLSTLAVLSGRYTLPTIRSSVSYLNTEIRSCLIVNPTERISLDGVVGELSKLQNALKNNDPAFLSTKGSENAANKVQSHTIPSHEVKEDDISSMDKIAVPSNGDSDDEFGDFESAPIERESTTANDMANSNVPIESIPSIKTYFGMMMRNRGLTRQLVKKPVCIVIYPKNMAIIRKSVDPESKVYGILSLKHPVHIMSLDHSTAELGEFRTGLRGYFSSTSTSSRDRSSSLSLIRLSLQRSRSDSSSDQSSLGPDDRSSFSEVHENTIVIGFESRAIVNEVTNILSAD